MKKQNLSLISLLLAIVMIVSALAGCKGGQEQDTDTQATSTETTENTTQTETESVGSDTETAEEPTETETEEDTTPMLSCDNAELIEYAERIANGVNYYYPDSKRDSAVLVNKEMSLTYALTEEGNKQVSALTNINGAPYLKNTMDVFIRMKSGNTYFASDSGTDANSNLYRFGFYYYQARYEGQNFINANITDEKVINHLKTSTHNNTEKVSIANNELIIKLTSNNDPFTCFGDAKCSTKDYNMLQVTMKADTTIRAGQIYIIAGSKSSFNSEQSYKFNLMADGNYHTYLIPLFLINDYTGNMKGLRFDIDGSAGSTYTVKEMKLVKADVKDSPTNVSIARTFNVYSDKMHHVLQVSATKQQNDIAEVGMLTQLSADTVEKLIVKDKTGLHESLDGVDWASAEYVGFDIKNAGIFGYILPADNNSGSIKVTLNDGIYSIEQTKAPIDGTIIPSEKETNNANDFYMGQRIYTDPTHTFDRFLAEAEEERHPLTADNFVIDTENSASASFGGYDALRGIYVLNFSGNGGAYSRPNNYPNVKFEVTGDKNDRKIYVMAYSPVTNIVEGAALLDDRNMMIPVPIEIGKNFSESAGERNLYNIDDPVYSEAIFPLVVNAEQKYGYNILNLYQNWGRVPLKQISWIQFYNPYYHLSTGVTETNCITPYYGTRSARGLGVLPDFRAMSAAPLGGQQRNSGGTHYFLQYTDAEGNYYTSENTYNKIGSYGLAYADVTMGYLSDDGKIKITYNHMEMPQTDENRTYYEMSYEFLDDISFKDFAKDFSFYSVRSIDPIGVYTMFGYLDKDNNPQVVNAKKAGVPAAYYTLGDNAPYFSYMKMTDDRANKSGYINLALLIGEYEFIIGGEKAEPNFVVADLGGVISLSLDLKEVTFKKGDKFTINCILLPWGSQDTVYDGSNGKAPDQNVRDVRENTILNPHKAKADKDCEVIDTAFVPMLKTTNGKSAEFTLSGGHNNVAVRIYGFKMLTVPQIYEFVNGQWVEYEVSSARKPDAAGNCHEFDGYTVYYDGDGTFSYSFIATMDNGADRRFKIVADTPFEGWKGISEDPEDKDPIDILVDHIELYKAALKGFYFKKVELHEEDSGFVRFYADPEKTEAHFKVFSTNIETGHYLVLKYRMPKDNPSKVSTFEFYTSTTEQGAAASNSFWSSGTLVTDGEWHVLVINLALRNNASYVPSSDGKYYANFLRLDPFNQKFNQKLNEGTYIDLQYVGMANTLDEIKDINSDMQVIQLSEEKSSYKEISVSGEDITVEYIHKDSGYTYSEKKYVSIVDKAGAVTGAISTSAGVKDIVLGGTVTDAKLTIAGWAIIQGGAQKYLWSADGGKTWNEVTGTRGTGSTAMVNKANEKILGAYKFTDADTAFGSFQGTGAIHIDLSAYKGQTVNLILAAVPTGETNSLCILSYVTDVTVP